MKSIGKAGKLKTIILEDDFFLKTILEMMCNQHPDILYLGAFDDVGPALKCMEQASVDLVLLDVQLRSSNGYELLKHLPVETRVVVVSSNPATEKPEAPIQVTAFLSKPVRKEQFLQVIFDIKQQMDKLG